jgi:uncharacterized protein (TIGR02246 family)
MTHDKEQIHALLTQYEALLNASNADAIAELYAADGVFMPQGFDSALGRAAVLQAYRAIFGNIALTIAFEIDEIKVADGIATALTRSRGTVRVNATGASAPEANRELFVFSREASEWRIARYMFNKAG